MRGLARNARLGIVGGASPLSKETKEALRSALSVSMAPTYKILSWGESTFTPFELATPLRID